MENVGDKIRVNGGEVEALIKIELPFGLFKSKSYQVVRRLYCLNENEMLPREIEIIKPIQETQTQLSLQL